MPGRFTRPVLAFSALALLAALAPAEGSTGDAQAGGVAQARARGAPGAAETAPTAGDAGETAVLGAGRAPAGGPGEAERQRAAGPAAHPGDHRVARKPAAVPGLALGAAVGRAARSRVQATADALTRQAERIEQRVAAYRAWGLEPPPVAPAPPVLKPRVRDATIVRSVPTNDRVVFLTIDDGAMKSPEFLRMIDALDIPVTSFVTDEEAELGPGYDYFRTLETVGGTTQNHTLHHPYLPALSYREQRREICGQQDRVQQETGGPLPRLFRPPYGAYDRDTLRAARACGIDAVVLWGMEAWADRIDFQEPQYGLYPGAIILTHYRGPASWGDGGTMVDMLRRVLERAAEEGYAIGRLEDYL